MEGHLETASDAVEDPHIPLDDVAVVVLDVSGQTEVTDLCHAMIRQQDVPRCNVPVDALTNGTFPNYNRLQLWMNVCIKDGVCGHTQVCESVFALTFLVDRKSRP